MDNHYHNAYLLTYPLFAYDEELLAFLAILCVAISLLFLSVEKLMIILCFMHSLKQLFSKTLMPITRDLRYALKLRFIVLRIP